MIPRFNGTEFNPGRTREEIRVEAREKQDKKNMREYAEARQQQQAGTSTMLEFKLNQPNPVARQEAIYPANYVPVVNPFLPMAGAAHVPWTFTPNNVPVIKKYNISLSGLGGDVQKIANLYEDVLPSNGDVVYNTYNTIGERMIIFAYMRSIFIRNGEGEDINIGKEGKDAHLISHLLSYVKLIDMNPYHPPNSITDNPYKTLPKNFIIWRSCYPVRLGENNAVSCHKDNVGVNIRCYLLTDRDRYAFDQGTADSDVIRELEYYRIVRDNIVRKNASPNFVVMYSYYRAKNTGIDFKKLNQFRKEGGLANDEIAKRKEKQLAATQNVFPTVEQVIKKATTGKPSKELNGLDKNKILDVDTFNKSFDNIASFVGGSESDLNKAWHDALQENISAVMKAIGRNVLPTVKQIWEEMKKDRFVTIGEFPDMLDGEYIVNNPTDLPTAFVELVQHKSPSIDFVSATKDAWQAIVTRNQEEALKGKGAIEPNKCLVLLTESPTINIINWTRRSYELDQGPVRKMRQSGFHLPDHWKSVLFQLVLALGSLVENDIMFREFSLEDNVFIKDLKTDSNTIGCWKYVYNGVTYYVPNYGDLVMIDSSFRDVLDDPVSMVKRFKKDGADAIYKLVSPSAFGDNMDQYVAAVLRALEQFNPNKFGNKFRQRGGVFPEETMDGLKEVLTTIHNHASDIKDAIDAEIKKRKSEVGTRDLTAEERDDIKLKTVKRQMRLLPLKLHLATTSASSIVHYFHNRVGTFLKDNELSNVEGLSSGTSSRELYPGGKPGDLVAVRNGPRQARYGVLIEKSKDRFVKVVLTKDPVLHANEKPKYVLENVDVGTVYKYAPALEQQPVLGKAINELERYVIA